MSNLFGNRGPRPATDRQVKSIRDNFELLSELLEAISAMLEIRSEVSFELVPGPSSRTEQDQTLLAAVKSAMPSYPVPGQSGPDVVSQLFTEMILVIHDVDKLLPKSFLDGVSGDHPDAVHRYKDVKSALVDGGWQSMSQGLIQVSGIFDSEMNPSAIDRGVDAARTFVSSRIRSDSRLSRR